jgi:hypothetical protein
VSAQDDNYGNIDLARLVAERGPIVYVYSDEFGNKAFIELINYPERREVPSGSWCRRSLMLG